MSKVQIEFGITVPQNDDEWKFNREAQIISDLYSKMLPKSDIPNLRKISIEIVDSNDYENFFLPSNLIKVCRISKYFDIVGFLENEENIRSKRILEMIFISLTQACEEFGWDLNPFELAYNKVIEVNYSNKYLLWNKKTFSNDRKYKAGIQLDVNVSGAHLSILFFDKKDLLVNEVEVYNVEPNYFFIHKIVGKAKWISNTEFMLSNKDEEIHFKASINSKESEVIITPISKTEQLLKSELIVYRANTSKEEKLKYFKYLNPMIS